MRSETRPTIRRATEKDTELLTLVIAEAVGFEVMEDAEQGWQTEEQRLWMKRLSETVTDERALYTWRHALVAEVDGRPAGALVCYAGDDYMQRREHTFRLVADLIDFDVQSMDAETAAGEFYLDSLAVLPAYRGKGIGSALLQEGIRQGERMQRPTVLACAPGNLNAKRLYERLGFRTDGRRFIFGENYLRMVKK